MFPLTFKKILLLQAIASASMLAGALISQYGFSLFPCELCLLQRYPYAAVIALSLLAWLMRREKLFFYAVLLNMALFALDAGIAFYHVGVEYDIFAGPDACSAMSGGEQTLEEMRAAILNAPLVSCKQAMAYFFGLSMAAWNGMFASLFVAASAIGMSYVRRKN